MWKCAMQARELVLLFPLLARVAYIQKGETFVKRTGEKLQLLQ